jgi:hypothetical protein
VGLTLDYLRVNADGTQTDLGATAPATAGSYTVIASFAGSADYLSASAATTFSITRAMPAVSVADAGGTYNGQNASATASLAGASSLEGVGLTLDYRRLNADDSQTDLGPDAPASAGNYTVVASFAGSVDYLSASASAAFSITQATPGVGVSDAGGTYNGQPFPASAGVAGASSLESVGLTLDYVRLNADGTQTDLGATAPATAGRYDVIASYAGSADYTAASAATTFSIAPATPVVSVADAGGTYNGQPFPATATVAGASSLEGVGLTLDYVRLNAHGTPTDLGATAPATAGNYEVIANFAGSTDYTGASASATFSIAQAIPNVSVVGAGGVYNGQPFSATSAVAGASSLEGVGLTLDYRRLNADSTQTALGATAPSAAGNYTVVASFGGSTDYTAATASATFSITPATPMVSVGDAGGTYNGQPFPASAGVAGASSLESVGLTLD